jgi:hypothetical protein
MKTKHYTPAHKVFDAHSVFPHLSEFLFEIFRKNHYLSTCVKTLTLNLQVNIYI